MDRQQSQQQWQEPQRESRLRSNAFLRYSSMCTQMAIIILLGVWGGKKLDEKYPREFPLFTLILSVVSVVLAIYLVIKDLLKKK